MSGRISTKGFLSAVPTLVRFIGLTISVKYCYLRVFLDEDYF